MLSSERRGSSARRGMTVLGKIPAVPKPINLPSQRLENRGLDPNVEIVPRGSVSWGSAGRSPPTSSNAWGTPAQASSPPSSSGAWGPKAGAASVGNSGVSGGATLGGPGNIPRPTSGGGGTRPTSGGTGTRPLSAESLGQTQQSPDSFSSNSNSSSVWGARPSSASGVLGQAQPQLGQAQAQARPRSADISRPNRSLSEFGDQPGDHPPSVNAAWGNRGPPRRLGEEPHQVSRFQLTRTDFPTLGSEKNPDLRPQHGNSAADRGALAEAKGQHPEERRPPTPPGPHEEAPPMPPSGGYGHPDRGAADSWRREAAAFQGPPPAAEGNWHRDGPSARPSYGGQGPQPESWRREAGSGGPADDNWRRGGAPPVGQYGPPPGPSHYPHEGPGFMHQPRFGPGPAAFGRGAPGPGGYGHHGDMYGNAGPLLRPAGPMHPMRPNMFQGPVPYDGFYGPPGPGYQGMEDPERMMMGMGGGPYGGFAQHRGPPPDAFGRFPHGGMNQGPRHPVSSSLRERGDPAGGDGYHEGPNYHKEGPEGLGHKDGRGFSERYGGGPGVGQEGGESRRGGSHRGAPGGADVHSQGQRGGSGGHHGGHRDWGAAASSDEPMDFSKPVFEEEVASASPGVSGKQSPAAAQRDESSVEEVKREDVRAEVNGEKSVVEVEVVKDEEKKVVVAVKNDPVAPERSVEVSSAPKSRAEGGDVSEGKGKEQGERKMQNVVDKEVVAKVVAKDGPGKWERGSKRGDSHTREVIGPAAGSASSSSLRSGQIAVGGAAKSSILGNAPRSAGADVAAAPQILQHPSQEKASAGSAPPAAEMEAPKAVDKGRVSRRPESPKVESVSVETTGGSDVSAIPAATVHESSGKEGSKAKGKASSHDGEKEWRPKVPVAEASPRPSAAAVAPASKPAVASSSSGTETTEDSNAESETGPKPGSYDYDAQRAKMKEIAAQRARQLQKEEEERIKEQKAKARAKLEELDRRSTVVSAESAEEAAVEAEEALQAEESPAVEAEAVLLSGSSSGSTKRGARSEHGKRERDRKANGRKAGVGEGAKSKVNGLPGQGSAILPPPVAIAAPLLTTPMPVPEVYGQAANVQRESRHRGRLERKQVVAKSEEGERPLPASSAGTFADIAPAGVNGGWHMDTPLAVAQAREPDSANTSHHPATSGTEGSGSVRKKNSRNSRNRPLPEAPAAMTESIQFGDIVSRLHIHTAVGGEQGVDVGGSAFHVDVGKDGNVSVSGDALTGDEGSAVSTNGDASGKRMQRKSRGARRGPGRGDRGSQDQRAAEKSHGSDSMVWAPVRSAGGGGGNKGEQGPHLSEQQKEESSSAQQQARAKRAEMERYTPKPLMKYQESSDQPAGPVAHQHHTQGAQGQSGQGAGAASVAAAEAPRVVSAPESKQYSSADAKSNHDTRPVESGTKAGKSHGSWRQRGSGSERVTEGAKDAPAPGTPAGSGHGDSGHPRQRSEQKGGGGGQAPSRRHQAASDHTLATPPGTPSTAGPAPAPGPPPALAPAAVGGAGSVQVSEREHPADKKLYQPPRPGSAAAHRGQDHRVQDYRGQDHRGQEHRGQDHRGQDFRGQDHRGQDHRGQSSHALEQKGQEQGTARHSNAASERAAPGENVGSQQHQRNGGGQHQHGRSQNADKEQAPSQQAYTTPQSQQKSHPGTATKEPGHPASLSRESQQQQQSSRGSSQHSGEGGEQGLNHRGGRFERDQAARPSGGAQRGQGHWQQTGGGEGFRSGPSRPHAMERDSTVGGQFGRTEASKQQAPESQRGQQAEQAGQQQNKAGQQTPAPVGIPGPKVEGGNWEGAGDGPAVLRGRDHNQGRRGRGFGGRSGPRSMEMESRRDGPSSKQRLVVNATGGAVPSQVAG